MDIQVASNFERYLFYVYQTRIDKFKDFINSFESSGSAKIHLSDLPSDKDGFITSSVSDMETIKRIRLTYEKTGYVLDPHTAVASEAATKLSPALESKTIILATAHPAKFPDSIAEAGLTIEDMPEKLSSVYNDKERAIKLDADKDIIFNLISNNNF